MRVGLSGCGRGAERIAAVRRHGYCDIVALHDADAASCQQLGAETGIALCTDDFEALLGTGVDFVVLDGPPGDRLAQVEAAAAQGAHCMCWAPMAIDGPAASAMVEACDRAGTRLGIAVPFLADPLSEELRRLLADDWLGAAVLASALCADDSLLRVPPPAGDWRRDPRRHGHGALVQLASAALHSLCFLLGRSPVATVALAVPGRLSGLAQDSACAAVELRGGILCTLAASHATQGTALSIHGTDGMVRLGPDGLLLRGRRQWRGAAFDYLEPGREVLLPAAELAAAADSLLAEHELTGRFARFLDDRDDFPVLGAEAARELAALTPDSAA